MGWARPPPHGRLLGDRLVEDDLGVTIGKQRLRLYGKFSEVCLDIFVDEILVVGRSPSPDVDDATYRKTVPFIRSWQDSKNINRLSARLSFCGKKRRSLRGGFLKSTAK